jgi:hypothetical protein
VVRVHRVLVGNRDRRVIVEQREHHRLVARERAEMQRRRPGLVDGVHVGTGLEEHPRGLRKALPRADQQRGRPFVVGRVDVAALVNQKAHRGHLAAQRRMVQQRRPFMVPLVEVHLGTGEQPPHRLYIAPVRGWRKGVCVCLCV